MARKPALRARMTGNTVDNPRASGPSQVWEYLTAKMGRQDFGRLVDDMHKEARKGRRKRKPSPDTPEQVDSLVRNA